MSSRDGWPLILEPPSSVQKLQMALQAKAKAVLSYWFYLLYDRLHHQDILNYAYRIECNHQFLMC